MHSLKTLLVLLFIHLSLTVSFGQECEDFENVGPQPFLPFFVEGVSPAGFYSFPGQPTFIDIFNCTPGGEASPVLESGNIEINDAGKAMLYHNPDVNGISFKAGESYEYSLSKVLSELNNVPFTEYENPTMTVSLSNELEFFGTNIQIVTPNEQPKSISELGDAECHPWETMVFTSNQDYKYMIFSIDAIPLSPPNRLGIGLDDICIQQASSVCSVNFQIENSGCGNIFLTDISQGATNLVYTITEQGLTPYQVPVTSTTMNFTFQNGNHTVSLRGLCNGVPTTFGPTTITVTGNSQPVFQTCPTQTINVNPSQCPFDYVLPNLMPFDADGDLDLSSLTCNWNGQSYTTSVPLPHGIHTISCSIIDDCGNNKVCDYTVNVNCLNTSTCTPHDLPLGTLPQIGNGSGGVFTGLGDPVVVPSECSGDLTLQSILIQAGTLAGGPRDYIAIASDESPNAGPLCMMGEIYEISGVKGLSMETEGELEVDYNNVTLTMALTDEPENLEAERQVIMSKNITSELTAGGCVPWTRMSFTSDKDYLYLVVSAETSILGETDELYIALEDICISQISACSDMSDLEDGPLLDPPLMSMTGIYKAYGTPMVVAEDCTDPPSMSMKGIRLKANISPMSGDGILISPEPNMAGEVIFKIGEAYEYSLKKLESIISGGVATYSDVRMIVSLTDDTDCMGDCQVLADKDIKDEIAEGICKTWDPMMFVPEKDYAYMHIYIEATSDDGDDDLYVVIDDLCVSAPAVSGGECEASFTYDEIGCDSIKFTSTSTGAVSWQYEFFGPGNIAPINSADACVHFDTPGIYQVQLSITCTDGSFDRSPIDSITIIANNPPFYNKCPQGLIFLTGIGEDCEVDFMLPDVGEDDPDGDLGPLICTVDNNPITGNTVTLTEGPHVIRCTVTDSCGNFAECDYEVIVECVTQTDSTDCTNFDDGNVGAWRRYNSLNGNQTVDNNPSAIAGGPSGLPGDNYLNVGDRGGSTWLINQIDYSGNWNQYLDQCICFDYNLIDDATAGSSPTVNPSIYIVDNFDVTQPIVWGTNPVLAARWTANTAVDENTGWVNLCPDVALCDGLGNLPSNIDGTWSWVGVSGGTCTDWNTLLSSVGAVMFGVDLTASVSEILGVDNICIGPCPPEPDPCMFDLAVDTLMGPDGECCYELDFDAQESWSYVTFNLQTPGVIFNTAMVDTNTFRIDTLSNGTQLRVASKNPGWGGQPAGNYLDFMKFCFANVDSASQTPQCVIAEYFKPGPVDGAVLACRDTLKFTCPAPTEVKDTCLTIENMVAECDEEDPLRYKLTFSATNNSNFTASQVNLSSLDPNVNFLPIGAPPGAIPQSTISVPVPGGLAQNGSITLMVNLVLTSALSSPQSWCLSGHLYSQSMCCTAPDEYCTELDVCCDPCERNDIFVEDISGIAIPQVLTFGASDDGQFGFVQVGFTADASGPTMAATNYNSLVLSDGSVNRSYINFDIQDAICEGAVVNSASLKLFGNDVSPFHYNVNIDNTCFKLKRVVDSWTETSLAAGTVPSATATNELTLDSPDFPSENYTIDVTTLINDMIANPSMGHGFELSNTCGNQHMGLVFATKEHPNTSLHPQLILTIDDGVCENPSLEGECCHEIDIINECETDFFTKVELKSITPGVNIGSHATGGSSPQDWYVSNSTPNCVTWNHNSGYIPSGTSNDIVQFCLDDIDATETPQKVVLHWYAVDGNGEQYIACSDTMEFECVPTDNPCIAVIDTQLKGSPCDSLDCYEEPWCVQWLRDMIANQAGLPEIQSYNTIEKGYWNGQVVFIATNPTPSGAANIGNTDIYLCNGNLIQNCRIEISGENCSPDAGIDPFADVTGKMLVWQTGDAIPPLDPDCGSGTGGQNIIDVCLTFKNTSLHYADKFIIYPITSGVNYWPNPINLLPGGTNICDTTTVDFQLYGPAIIPGANVKFAVRLADSQNPDDWCCFESDTVCVIIPTCPTEECCESEDEFDALVAQGFQITQNGCSIQVCANQFDTCHWFPNQSPNWGDGNPILPAILQSDPPNNCWTWTYAAPGNYTITLPVWEGTEDSICWQGELVYEFMCDEDTNPCDNLLITNSPTMVDDSTCCSTFTVTHQDATNEYKGVVVNATSAGTISQVQGLSGYIVNNISPTRVEITHPSGIMPQGTFDIFTLCTTGFTGTHSVTVAWLQITDDGCLEVCPSEHEMDCSIGDDMQCFTFVQDSVHCESMTYCFQIENTSNPAFSMQSVILYGINGGSLSPTSINIPNGPLAPGATSDWICVNYSGASPGDDICYSIAIEDANANTPSNICCTDTLVQCFEVPECDTNPCDSLLVTNSPTMVEDSTCCSTFTVTHQDAANEYKGVVVNATSAGTISQVRGLSGYIVSQITPTRVEITHPSGIMPQGTFDIFTLCTTGFTGTHSVTVAWLQITNDGCLEVCPSEHEMDCSIGDDMQCFTFVQDSVHCESMTYCFQIENTSNPAFSMQSVILYGINGGSLSPTSINIPNGPLAPGATSDWICVNYSGASPGDDICYSIAIEDANANSPSNICCTDTLVQCFEVPDCPADDCCDITEEEFFDVFEAGVDYNLTGCELCLPFALDTCDYIDIDYGDGTSISLQGPTNVPCYNYSTTGAYQVTINFYRLNTQGDTCRQLETLLDISTSCPPVGGPCLSVIDGELDCEREEYCFRITNTSTFTMKSLAFVELTSGVALSPDPYQLLTPLTPGSTSELICLNYIGAFQGDTVCFDVVGHEEDITIGEAPSNCCKDTIPVCFVIDCPVSQSECISVVQDSIDCEFNTYCIKVKNNTFFDINSIAFHNFSAGHSLSPDPLGIPTLARGATSDWICLTFGGAILGDTVCYNIIGHEQDLSMGQSPIFCCSDTTQYCFMVDCETDPCCDMTIEEIDDYFNTGININIADCGLTLPFEEDSCAVLTIDFGDDNTSQNTGVGIITHTYISNGTYDVEVLLQYFNDNGEVCQEKDTIIEISVENCFQTCSASDLEIFNVLSPNNDGLNDRLFIEGSSTCQKNIKVYNRWGQLVYQKKDYKSEWTGNSFSGEQLAEGTYFLVVEIPDSEGNILDQVQTYIDIRK